MHPNRFEETIDVGYAEGLDCDFCNFLYALRPTTMDYEDSLEPVFYLVALKEREGNPSANGMAVIRGKKGNSSL